MILKNRYQLVAPIGGGGMGEVWRASNIENGFDCAIKMMRDTPDAGALEHFNKEQSVLAELRSPHIVQIYDIGVLDNGRPYFVMPLLHGSTLADLLKDSSDRITQEWVVDVGRQICRGLQAAHESKGKIYHGDLKPANIFVDESDSVTIFDFGVAHLGNPRNSGLRCTPQYAAPELIDPHSQWGPSPVSDLFSLAVTLYEMLTRQRAFERSTDRETLQAIIGYHPSPIWNWNTAVSLGVAKVIHKEMAKLPLHRYSSAREFADKLQKAHRGEPLSEFDPSRIRPRIAGAQKAFTEDADYQTAYGMLCELQNEGEVADGISELRVQVEAAMQQRTINQLLETARTLVAQGDEMAVPKIREILSRQKDHPDALRLLEEFKKKISEQDIERWFNLAKRHLDIHEYNLAHEALLEVLKIRPDSKAFEMLAEVEREEKEYKAVCLEKEALFQQAQQSYENGKFSTALNKLGRLLALIRPGDASILNRDVAYQDFYDRVHAEYDATNNACAEAQKYLADEHFDKAVEICSRYPLNPIFEALKLEIEDRQRHQRSAYVAEISLKVEAEPDLERKVAILEAAAEQYREDPQIQNRLSIARERQKLVASIVVQAQDYENRGEYNEALGRWESVRKIYPHRPGLAFEIDSVTRHRDLAYLAESLKRWEVQIDRFLGADDYEKALTVCANALGEFVDDAGLKEREQKAWRGLQLATEVQKRLEEAQEFIAKGQTDEALAALRSAQEIPVRSPLIRVLLVDTLARQALVLIDKDWRAAADLVDEALKLDPNHGPSRSMFSTLENYRRPEFVEQCASHAQKLEIAGELAAAVSIVSEGLERYQGEKTLIEIRERCTKQLLANERPQCLAELKRLLKKAQSEFDPGNMNTIIREARGIIDKYSVDSELRGILTQIDEYRRKAEKRQALRRRMRSLSALLDTVKLTRTQVLNRSDSEEIREPAQQRFATFRRSMVYFLDKHKWSISALCGALFLTPIIVALIPLRSVPVESMLGTAVVRAQQTDLLEAPRLNSRHILALLRGARVNILNPVEGRDQFFVRVQFVSPKKSSRPGFVRTSDLSQWASENPRIEWDFANLVRPSDSASEPEWRQFAEEMREFSKRFAGTTEADEANLERARLYLSFAAAHKEAGQPRPEWADNLIGAKEGLDAVSPTNSSRATELRQRLAELDAVETPQPGPISDQDRQLAILATKAYKLYAASDFDGILELAKQMDSIKNGRGDAFRRLVDDAKKDLHLGK
jgi:serine/threonine protein kinase